MTEYGLTLALIAAACLAAHATLSGAISARLASAVAGAAAPGDKLVGTVDQL